MLSTHKLLCKRYSKLLCLFLIVLLILSGCAAPMRNFGFSENVGSPLGPKKGPSVSIQNFTFQYKSDLKSKNTEEEISSILQKKLAEQLMRTGLNPVMVGKAVYNLNGKMLVTEDNSVNGLIVPMIAIDVLFCLPIFTCGLGPLATRSIPCFDFTDKAEAEFSLLHTASNKNVIMKKIEKRETFIANDYMHDITKPDSMVNSYLIKTIDDALIEIAEEVARVATEEK